MRILIIEISSITKNGILAENKKYIYIPLNLSKVIIEIDKLFNKTIGGN